jgi:hypothetical protein
MLFVLGGGGSRTNVQARQAGAANGVDHVSIRVSGDVFGRM